MIKQEMADVFSIFHDGAIESHVGDKSCLKLKIDCTYLAELINPSYTCFYVELNNIKEIKLDTYSKENTDNNPEELPNILCDIDDIFEEEIDIYDANVEGNYVQVNCWIYSDKAKYVANSLKFDCDNLSIFDENNKPITFAELCQIGEKYWSSFGNKS